jgi:exodeoxyribonuclease III
VVKLLAWNILHGGGSARMPLIALAIVEHAADAVILTEFRTTTGGQIRAILAEHGWAHQICTDPGRGRNGILIASRSPLDPADAACPSAVAPGKAIEASIPALGLRLLAVHIPCDPPFGARDPARAYVWRDVLRTARARRDQPCAVIGDFNTGRHHLDEDGASFSHTASIGKLASMGYLDAWRSRHPEGREPTWISHTGSGFRLDHAFLSRPLAARLQDAWYSHRERELRISDHSALVVSLA